MEWKTFAVFSLLIALRLGVSVVRADETTCMSDYEDGAILHFICFCNSPRLVHPDHDDNDNFVSLSSFAYGLSGSLFAKSIFVTFQSCRFLRVILDQRELRRIGSPNFRPDLQIKRLSFEHVYHLELERHVPPVSADEDQDYLAVPDDRMELLAQSVALVRVDRGADFTKLVSFSNSTSLYIDLTDASGAEEEFSVQGFSPKRVFFITLSKEVPLAVGEDLQVKMKNLASEMQSKSSILSLALSLSTIVILLGIFGLVVVANHRQRKREQLKAILRAKNLGPVLESRKIASEVGNNFNFLPKYTQVRKSGSSSISSPSKPKKSFKSSLPAALLTSKPSGSKKTAAELAAIDGKFQNRLKKLDFNEFLSGLLYRVRNQGENSFTPEHGAASASAAVGEFSPQPPQPPPPPPIKYTKPAFALPPLLPKKPPPLIPVPQTSFFYKEGSLTESESSSTASSSSSSSVASSCGDVIRETVEVEVNKVSSLLKSEVKKRRSSKSASKGASRSSALSSALSSGTSSTSSRSSSSTSSSSTPGSAKKFRRQQESRSGSYMSKISQQVFVHEPPKVYTISSAKDSASTSTGSTEAKRAALSTPKMVLKQQKQPQQVPPEDFQGELKEKCMTFFSSVTRTKADMVSDKTKL